MTTPNFASTHPDANDEWNTRQVKLKLNVKTDKDILEWVDWHRYGRGTSVQGAIKALIREDIAQGQTLTARRSCGQRDKSV